VTQVLDRLRRLPTAAISDALDRASVRGIAGTVINGVCRDVSTSLSHSYPLFSRGRFMRTGKDRVRLVSIGKTMTVSGVDISPGAIVCADADGAVAVPAASVERITGLAEQIEQIESEIVVAVRAGNSLREARENFGYHTLQSRRS
jgi:4-hydroxy-4-methyl-2-oxoglutarate aldolase